MTDDSRIVDLFLSRDESAIALTAEKYGARLRRLANGILQDPQAAEECENDTYLKAWQSIPPHEPRGYLFSYLGEIIRNLAINECQKRSRFKRQAVLCELTEEMKEILPGNESVEMTVEETLLAECINRFLDGCPAEQRCVFIRRYWFFEPIEEIAARYDFSASKVKSILYRLRKRLQTYLEEEGYKP